MPFKGRAQEWSAMTPDEARRLQRLRAILGEPFNPVHFRELLWAEFTTFLAQRDEEAWRALLGVSPPSPCRPCESIPDAKSATGQTNAGLYHHANQKGG
jgi:hypothetical protein